MNINNYGKRYLETDKFLNLCRDLDLKLLGGPINENWLEYLEKERILFPELRIQYPDSYAKYLFYKDRGANTDKIKLTKSYEKLEKLIEDYEFNKSLPKIFHPFDKIRVKSQYGENPSASVFNKWKNYKKEFLINRDKFNINTASHYYHYYHVYYLYEITKACTLKYVINVFDKDVQKYSYEKKIPSNKIKYKQLPFAYEFPEGDFLNKAKEFDMLSIYICAQDNIELIPLPEFREYLRLSKEERLEYDNKVEESKKKLAAFILSKHKFNEQQLFDFLIYLCKKYFDYERGKVDKLCDLLREDIFHFIKFICHNFNYSIEQVTKKVGRIKDTLYENSIKYIFEGDVAEAREDFFRISEGLVSGYANHLNINVTKSKFQNFIKFLDDNHFNSIYLAFYRAYYAPRERITYYDIVHNLMIIAISFEDLLKNILLLGDHDPNVNISKKIEGNFLDVLKYYFRNDRWIDTFKQNVGNYILNQSLLSNLDSLKSEIKNKIFHKDKKYNELTKVFLLTYIIRNLAAHRSFKLSSPDIYPVLFEEALMTAIWYSWEYALENYNLYESDKNE